MARKTYTYTRVKGLRDALRALPEEAQRQLGHAFVDIAGDVAEEAGRRARALGGVSGLVAPSIKAVRDPKSPRVRMGSRRRLPRQGDGWGPRSRRGDSQTIGALIFAAEFGASPTTYPQFADHPHRGTRGWFLWPTVRESEDAIMDRIDEAVLRAADEVA